MLKEGIRGQSKKLVAEEDTAARVGSGLLEVFATPAMIALMERTAAESVEGYLEEGMTTVGTWLQVSHVSATPVGMNVVCESELVKIDGKRLRFRVEACDAAGLIGEGDHERFIVDKEKFMKRATRKKEDEIQ